MLWVCPVTCNSHETIITRFGSLGLQPHHHPLVSRIDPMYAYDQSSGDVHIIFDGADLVAIRLPSQLMPPLIHLGPAYDLLAYIYSCERCLTRHQPKPLPCPKALAPRCMPALTALSNVPCHAFKTAYIMGMISASAKPFASSAFLLLLFLPSSQLVKLC